MGVYWSGNRRSGLAGPLPARTEEGRERTEQLAVNDTSCPEKHMHSGALVARAKIKDASRQIKRRDRVCALDSSCLRLACMAGQSPIGYFFTSKHKAPTTRQSTKRKGRDSQDEDERDWTPKRVKGGKGKAAERTPASARKATSTHNLSLDRVWKLKSHAV